MMNAKKISIIIPVYNEEKTILNVLENVKKLKLQIKKEIVIVDDGSRDSSREVISEYLKKQKKNKSCYFVFVKKSNEGKGSAIRAGIEKSSGELIIAQDADLEYRTEDIAILIEEIKKGESEVVYGSRILKKNPYHYLSYYLGNSFLSLITSILYGARITDMETCYKLAPLNIIKRLRLESNKFDIEPEITAKILKLGYKIKELPISYNPRTKEEGKKINWKDGILALLVLLKWRFKKI